MKKGVLEEWGPDKETKTYKIEACAKHIALISFPVQIAGGKWQDNVWMLKDT